MTLPTQAEIVQRWKARADNDPLGFEIFEYGACLDADHVRPFMKPDADLTEWKPAYTTAKEVEERLRGYMDFAWDKANNRRGISANRSIMHAIAWLWLMGGKHREFGAVVEQMFEEHYVEYGKAILATICEHLDIDWRKLDDDAWVNDEFEEGRPAADAFANWEGRYLAEPYLKPTEAG